MKAKYKKALDVYILGAQLFFYSCTIFFKDQNVLDFNVLWDVFMKILEIQFAYS